MSLIVFSHANSFPASTYGVLFKSLRSRGHAVRAVDRFGHDPRYPVTSNWPHLVQQLVGSVSPGKISRRRRNCNLDRLLRRHPLQCPVAFIGGTRSAEMKLVGMAMTNRLVDARHPGRKAMVEGSHLFPMERPLETAAAIESTLRALGHAP